MQKLWTLIGVKNQCWRISKLRTTPCWRISSGLKNGQIKRKPMLKNQLRVEESANWEKTHVDESVPGWRMGKLKENPCWIISKLKEPMLKSHLRVEECKLKEPMLKNQQIDSSNFSMRRVVAYLSQENWSICSGFNLGEVPQWHLLWADFLAESQEWIQSCLAVGVAARRKKWHWRSLCYCKLWGASDGSSSSISWSSAAHTMSLIASKLQQPFFSSALGNSMKKKP